MVSFVPGRIAGLVALIGILPAGFASGGNPEIPGWGQAIDPAGDCEIRGIEGKVTVRIPATLHDLCCGVADETKQFKAPRVWRAVEGDFTVQVKVSADDWTPGPALEGAQNQPYAGAGLLVWDTRDQYLHFERNVCAHATRGTYSLFTPLYARDGRFVNAWKGTKQEFFKGRSSWLRLVRRGSSLSSSMSHDGQAWTTTDTIETTFPARVLVGIVAVNGSKRAFLVAFEDFRLSSP